jgi:hypothetical protein
MIRPIVKTLIISLVLSLCFAKKAYSKNLKIVYPVISDSEAQSNYFLDILKEAAKNSDVDLEIDLVKYPHLRIKNYLKTGKVTLFQMQETDKRNGEYIPIKVGLTNKLIGKRVFFIRDNEQPTFDKIKNLSDLRESNLIGAFGLDWLDATVWKQNNLKHKEVDGIWSNIYRMLEANRNIDYFPRSIIEIMRESEEYPFLSIEKNLLLEFDSDYIFYVSKKSGLLDKDILLIEKMLLKAKRDGIIDWLIQKYWADDFNKLNLINRKVLKLNF